MNKLVSLPIAVAVPTAAPAFPATITDPIFAAIDAYRRADAACSAVDGDIPDELGDRRGAASKTVMRTRPITPAGLSALTTWAREMADEMESHSVLFGEDLCALAASIDDAVRGMVGLNAWSPPTSSTAAVAQSDQVLVEALEGMLSADKAIDDLHKAYGDDADGRDDYAEIEVRRNDHIATLVTVPAASSIGVQPRRRRYSLSALSQIGTSTNKPRFRSPMTSPAPRRRWRPRRQAPPIRCSS